MNRERILFFIVMTLVINLFLLYQIFAPQIDRVRSQVENADAIETFVTNPLYHDYYFDYLFVESKIQGNWRIDVYKEVQTLLDSNGHKLKEVETGNYEYMRYWIGG